MGISVQPCVIDFKTNLKKEKTKTLYRWTDKKRNVKLASSFKKTKFTFIWFTKVCRSQNVFAIFPHSPKRRCEHNSKLLLTSTWEQKFILKKREMFRHWRRTLKQIAHPSTMPKLFTCPDSTWPCSHNVPTRGWMSISLAGHIHRRSEFMEEKEEKHFFAKATEQVGAVWIQYEQWTDRWADDCLWVN